MNEETADSRMLHELRFFVTPGHSCSYLPEQEATTLFVDPQLKISSAQYTLLAKLGFRRSGEHIYRPHCSKCHACIPVRIPVHAFSATRSQQRTWNRNRDLSLQRVPAEYNEEHFQLYRCYMQTRHPGGGMDDDDPESYRRIIASPWCDTFLFEFRLRQRLLAVAITDQLGDALSAMYTFFDPALARRSLGVYAILQQIEQSKAAELQWLYLGYWIKQSPKMAYKDKFRPLEYFDGHNWRRLASS